jgi:uncharacterized membrane-anchored protein
MILTNITSRMSVLGLGALLAGPAFAEGEPAAGSAPADNAPPELHYQSGDIVLPNKVATLHLGSRYRYLDPANAETMLLAWGNPDGSGTQGAIVPADTDPFAGESWAVILTYVKDGHIDDSDATKIDYDDLLKDMKEGEGDENAERKKAGYSAVHTVGWAEKPSYDSTSKRLYWAKELDFEGSKTHTLNYDVRVLGREGVLSMNAVGSMSQLEQIRGDMRPLIQVADFNSGYRYAEFNKKTDKLAEYGLGALVVGGVAAKLGLFAKLGVFLLAFKKILFAGILAVGAFIGKFFKKKDNTI